MSQLPEWMTTEEDGQSDAGTVGAANAEFEAAVNPTRRFRIQSTSASRDVACLVDEVSGQSMPEALGDILTRSGLTFGQGMVFQLDGADIGYGQIVQPGGLIIAIGAVKGA